MPFGKYKSKKMDTVPGDYIKKFLNKPSFLKDYNYDMRIVKALGQTKHAKLVKHIKLNSDSSKKKTKRRSSNSSSRSTRRRSTRRRSSRGRSTN